MYHSHNALITGQHDYTAGTLLSKNTLIYVIVKNNIYYIIYPRQHLIKITEKCILYDDYGF